MNETIFVFSVLDNNNKNNFLAIITPLLNNDLYTLIISYISVFVNCYSISALSVQKNKPRYLPEILTIKGLDFARGPNIAVFIRGVRL